MTRADRKLTFEAALERLGAGRFGFSATEIARLTGTSRQATHRRLARMVSGGELTVTGRARGTRYHLRPTGAPAAPVSGPAATVAPAGTSGTAAFARAVPLRGLEEDALWREVGPRLPGLSDIDAAPVRAVLAYAFTELVNNAVNHSRADSVLVRAGFTTTAYWFEVEDQGIGAFENVRATLGLPDHLAALQEIGKGKVSTMPERHSGEGLFFTSKMADAFELGANGLRWLVDNLRDDEAVGTGATGPGTRVRFEVGRNKRLRPEEVFARYTHDFEFDTTRTVVRLYEHGVRFVSRSEAKRLVTGLHRFRQVVVDFRGVETVGQGFADEIFRVWAAAHPQIELSAKNMSPPVAFMVERSRRETQREK